MISRAACLAAGILCAAVTGAAQAAMVTYNLDLVNSGSGLSSGTTYATVNINDNGTPGSVQFTVTPANVTAASSGTFGITDFGFNSTQDLSGASYTLPSNWTADGAGNEDGFGKFQYRVGTTSNSNAQNPLQFTINSSGLTANDFGVASSGTAAYGNVYFAAHLVNYTVGGTTYTGYIGGPAPVPVPPAVWLFGSGLVGLVGVARRSRRGA